VLYHHGYKPLTFGLETPRAHFSLPFPPPFLFFPPFPYSPVHSFKRGVLNCSSPGVAILSSPVKRSVLNCSSPVWQPSSLISHFFFTFSRSLISLHLKPFFLLCFLSGMCRLTAYIGSPIVAADLVTRPTHSIIRQVSCWGNHP